MTQEKRLPEILAAYETALTEYGLSYSSRLHLSGRAKTIVIRHEQQGKDYRETVADFFRETDERRYNGDIRKNHYYAPP